MSEKQTIDIAETATLLALLQYAFKVAAVGDLVAEQFANWTDQEKTDHVNAVMKDKEVIEMRAAAMLDQAIKGLNEQRQQIVTDAIGRMYAPDTDKLH